MRVLDWDLSEAQHVASSLVDAYSEQLDAAAAMEQGWEVVAIDPARCEDALSNLWRYTRHSVNGVCPEMAENLRTPDQRRPQDPEWAYAGKVVLENESDFAAILEAWDWSCSLFEAGDRSGVVFIGVEGDVEASGTKDFLNAVVPESMRVPRRETKRRHLP